MASRFQIPHIPSSEITPESVYLRRRQLMKAAGLFGGAAAANLAFDANASMVTGGKPLEFAPASPGSDGFHTGEDQTPFSDASQYCNFYEFGTGKSDPVDYAHEMTTDPWKVEVVGEANNKGTFDLQDILKGLDVEERIYRFRCVEAWSMVVPWMGVPLKKMLEKFEPNSHAKYVAFETLHRPAEMRGQRSLFSSLEWPYLEGLRMDEAYHPLSLMVTGLYGKPLPNQNGAPWRLMVPWKYGFKSIKSIVRITLTDEEPPTTWNMQNRREYGFYSNVNPEVNHPRWSQASERRIGGGLFARRIPTLMFNGYEEEVASMYEGMDLSGYF